MIFNFFILLLSMSVLHAETPHIEDRKGAPQKSMRVTVDPLEQSRFVPWAFVSKKNDLVTCSWIRGAVCQSERNVFVSAFTHAYKDLRLEQLFLPAQVNKYAGLSLTEENFKTTNQDIVNALQIHKPLCLNKFLHEAWDDEDADLNDPTKEIYTASATINGKVIGVVAFNQTEIPGQVYLRQLAVDPDYWRRGIGTNLVYSVFRVLPNTKHLVLAVRRLNKCARDFYDALNFTECNYMYEKLVTEKYIGLQLFVPENVYFDVQTMTFKIQPAIAWQQVNK